MTIGSALKPRFAAGEYPCTWVLSRAGDGAGDARVPGSLTLEGGRMPTGHAYGADVPTVVDLHGMSFPQVSTHRVIRCELAIGAVATLVDAQVRIWAPDRARISASYVLVGSRYPAGEEAAVCRLRTQVTGLEAITATAPLERTVQIPRLADTTPVSVTMSASPSSFLHWEDASAELVSDYASRAALADLYGTKHVFSPHLTLDLDEPVAFDELSAHWIDSLHRLSSVATGERQRITHVTVTGEDELGKDSQWEVFAAGVTQQPFASEEKVVRETRSALALARDGDSLLALLREWDRLDTARHPIIHSFGREVSTLEDHTPRAQFLTLIQALEGTHRVENEVATLADEQKHQAKRAALLDAVAVTYLPPAERKFLSRNLSKSPTSGLDRALHWTRKVLPGDLAADAGQLTIVKEKLDDQSATTWADAIRMIRNDYSHANRSYDPYELRELVLVLKRYATAMCLRLIGASDAAQLRATAQDP